MNILLGVTGSVAATVVPKLYANLVYDGHNVEMVATTPAMYFLPEDIFYTKADIYQDKVEWPNSGYHKGDIVKHIEFRDWADMLVIAPLTANTLGKISNGIADNFLSCIVRAWPKQKPVVLAPAMNTEMWIDPITDEQIMSLHRRFRALKVVEPISKVLACGEVGLGAMAEIHTILQTISSL